MSTSDRSTEGITLTFGKHRGQLLTRVPVSYLRWIVNQVGMDPYWKKLANAEHTRRGGHMPRLELSGHAIDNASLRIRHVWHETREEEEGLYSWLMRVAFDA